MLNRIFIHKKRYEARIERIHILYNLERIYRYINKFCFFLWFSRCTRDFLRANIQRRDNKHTKLKMRFMNATYRRRKSLVRME